MASEVIGLPYRYVVFVGETYRFRGALKENQKGIIIFGASPLLDRPIWTLAWFPSGHLLADLQTEVQKDTRSDRREPENQLGCKTSYTLSKDCDPQAIRTDAVCTYLTKGHVHYPIWCLSVDIGSHIPVSLQALKKGLHQIELVGIDRSDGQRHGMKPKLDWVRGR